MYHYDDMDFSNFIRDFLLSNVPITTRLNIEGFTFSRDLGKRYAEIGNRSGYDYNANDYRWFELNLNGKSLNFVMFRMFFFKFERYNRHENTYEIDRLQNYFITGIGNSQKQHSSLQLDMGNCMRVSDPHVFEVFHEGDLTLSNLGSRKPKEVLGFMREHAPFLFGKENWISLGKFKESKHPKVESVEIEEFLLRTAIYAYYRDVYRWRVKAIKSYR